MTAPTPAGMPTPEVSVVMSIYNGAASLCASVDSVLSQSGCDLELVAINDGSTDETGGLLDSYARRDARVRVIHLENGGLTRALVVGCNAARGEFIARQDADDVSLANRFSDQRDVLIANPDAVLVAGAVRYLAPGGEWLFDHVPAGVIEVELDIARFRAPLLLGTLFRRSAYERIGGFRPQFWVAQDADLWLRLLEVGPCLGVDRLHYQTRLTQGGISSRSRGAQMALSQLAIDCARRRRAGLDDAELLRNAPPRRSHAGPLPSHDVAAFDYFIGACLRHKDPRSARRYFRSAWRRNPLHVKALLRWMGV